MSSTEEHSNLEVIDIIETSLKERLNVMFHKHISELFNIWKEVGTKSQEINAFADQVFNHVQILMKEMVDESITKKTLLLKNIKSFAQSARKLSKELGVNFNTESHDDLPLIDLEIYLQTQLEKLREMKNHRLKYVKELIAKELEICQKLGTKPTGFNSELPSEEEIKDFENQLSVQEQEKNRLSETFKETRRSIIKMMEELEINPSQSFEKSVCYNQDNFIYSSSNMSELRQLRDTLKERVEEVKLEITNKKDILMALWDYLDEPIEVRQDFLNTYTGFNLPTISALDEEIKRCKAKRSENVANYINKIRIEVENLWALCKYSETQKKAFTAMKSQTYTDHLLVLHEIEVENLRKYYNSNRKIFELLNEWEIQFEKLKDLDQRANDPDRYHNRGGQLLMEEKERKAVEKKLPKLENQLRTIIEEYERTQRQTFLINGLSFKDFINQAVENYELEKENMKLARKQAKDRSTKKTPLSTSKRTPGLTTSCRLTPASSRLRTPGGNNISRLTPAAKRKLPCDPSPTVADKKRAIAEKHKVTVVCNTKVRRSNRISGGASVNKCVRPKGNKIKCKRPSKNDTTLSISSYDNFQEHLNNRNELRSSVLPEEVLRRAGKKTPIKTPIKPVRRKVLADSTPINVNSTRTLRGTPRSPRMMSSRLIPVQDVSPIEI